MSKGLSRKGRGIFLLASLALALAGCGFHPLYGGGEVEEVDSELAAISVATVPERVGQMLVISLRDSLNPGGIKVPPRYSLTITLATSRADFAIRKDATASRQLYAASASFVLRDNQTSQPVFSGSARANDSYDVGTNPYTTIVAGNDADRKAALAISEQIRTQLALYMHRRART